MKMTVMSKEKIKKSYEPWAAKTNALAAVKIMQALLSPGVKVRGLFGPDTQERDAPEGDNSQLGQTEDHRT